MFSSTSSLRLLSLQSSKSYSHVIRNLAAMNKFDLPNRCRGNDKSVWVEYLNLATKYKPLNLGQGFPDFFAPKHVTDALAQSVRSDNPLINQYTRAFGHPRLVEAIGKVYSKVLDRELDPYNEVIVTVGAYEALYCAIQGHTEVGDEWIIIEPFFDCYEPQVRMAGGVPRFIPLKPTKTTGVLSSADWVFDRNEMASLFNEKTKGIIINTPHNPLGKVFTLDELRFIATLAKQWNTLVIADEVYEWMTFDSAKHIRFATLPDMWERTITIGSAGKTFSVTGWKLGWAYGPANLLWNLRVVHQNCVYTSSTPTQEAVAIGFEGELKKFGKPDCYFTSLADELLPKRDYMVKFLADIGMSPTIPEGGYFMVANWKPLEKYVRLEDETDPQQDYKFTKWMTKNVGIQGIPPSAFYCDEHKYLGEDYVRYCFIKKDENLQKAAELLNKWKPQQV